MGVYAVEDKEGKKRSVVTKPTQCVVFCKGCQDICPAQAITHPSAKETRETIRKLQKTKG
jgi:formate hydrogenlyase subunit 6/NADH:ubiquinone oxidoreductase subunit I